MVNGPSGARFPLSEADPVVSISAFQTYRDFRRRTTPQARGVAVAARQASGWALRGGPGANSERAHCGVDPMKRDLSEPSRPQPLHYRRPADDGVSGRLDLINRLSPRPGRASWTTDLALVPLAASGSSALPGGCPCSNEMKLSQSKQGGSGHGRRAHGHMPGGPSGWCRASRPIFKQCNPSAFGRRSSRATARWRAGSQVSGGRSRGLLDLEKGGPGVRRGGRAWESSSPRPRRQRILLRTGPHEPDGVPRVLATAIHGRSIAAGLPGRHRAPFPARRSARTRAFGAAQQRACKTSQARALGCRAPARGRSDDRWSRTAEQEYRAAD